MKLIVLPVLLAITSLIACGQEQKVVGDCTVTFTISGGNPTLNADLAGTVKTFYLKGKLSRVDFANSAYQQSSIYDNATGNAVILQQVGANKYMTRLTPEKWAQKNSNYQGATFIYSNETKTILDYACKKGSAVLKNGNTFTVYYATAIIPSATENPFQFKDIPGFVLEYQIAEKNGSSVITYTASKINFSPVPASVFDIPTSGYTVREE